MMRVRGLRFLRFIAAVSIVALCVPVVAAIDVYEFDNEHDQARFRGLADELRCPKCLNTNLAGSDAPIASDLRREIHRLIGEGRSDGEIRDFMVLRYGDFVLYRPPFRLDTAVLWIAPTALLFIGAFVVFLIVWRRRSAEPAVISAEEESRLARLLEQDSE